MALQQIISRNRPPASPSVLSFGRFIANSVTNVIPNEVMIEGTDLAGMHHNEVADDADFVAPLHRAVGHVATCHRTNLADLEYLAHLNVARDDLFLRWCQ